MSIEVNSQVSGVFLDGRKINVMEERNSIEMELIGGEHSVHVVY